MISHIEVRIPEKPLTSKNIDEYLKDPQIQLWKEALFMQYDKKKYQTSFGSHTNHIPTSSNKDPMFTH